MPLTTCTLDGKDGWKYGSGTCYVHDGTPEGEKAAKAKAIKQALATNNGTPPKDLSETELADATKTCANCGKQKAVDAFPADGRTSDGLSAQCVTCKFKSNHSEREFADMLQTVDIPDVPILSTGGPFKGSGSADEGDFFKPEQLQAIEAANRALGSQVKIPIKLGHNRSQKLLKNSGLFTDEQPAAGWVENLRYRPADGKLIGDLKRVPRKLAELMKVGAFRTRSVELSRIAEQGSDDKPKRTFDSVITGLALLGSKAPAVKTLDDIWALYADVEDAMHSRFADGIEATPVEYHTYSDAGPIVSDGATAVDTADVTARVKWELAQVKETREAADTKGMSETASTQVATPAEGMSDEQIAKFAEAFGIDEADATARRAKVLDKFSEFAVAPEKKTEAKTEAAAPVEGAAAAAATATEDSGVKALAEEIKTMKADAKTARVKANVATAIRQCRFTPADRDRLVAYGEHDEEGLIDLLVKQPIRTDLMQSFGSDDDGSKANAETKAQASDDLYKSYASQTGVQVVATGGKAA